jgi:hypothetical protein
VYLLIYIKPLDAFTSGAERLQSELVQTFLSTNAPFWQYSLLRQHCGQDSAG